ncbi:MAG: cellobiose phosphorylase [Halanaerobiaceae bacterium]|nr:cellobiose phosphorylase [Halanaerobiaceae bacterium]
MSWEFIDCNGTFRLENADSFTNLYFPLVNEKGMMSSITPILKGDIKCGQNHFLLQPVSIEDLHNNRSGRNFWLHIEEHGAWSVCGNSARQISARFGNYAENKEQVYLEAGFLWHKVVRESNKINIRAEVTNFVPVEDDLVELMQVTISNIGDEIIEFTPTAAIPIYGRSADNLRDHRHVTSLLHQIRTNDYGVIVKPTLSFDERGHKKNNTTYAVFGCEGQGLEPVGFYPVLEDFIGEGGTLDWPRSIVENSPEYKKAGFYIDGYESIGAIRFEDRKLAPGQSVSYIIVMLIDQSGEDLDKYIKKYCSKKAFDNHLAVNKDYWQARLANTRFYTGELVFDNWMKWVTLQPILRRIYGCSFLPHHDYGRGGKGWRDLWQDCLALLLMENENVRELLYNNYAGVRIDGSNATIIGDKPGEFIADRNNIPRFWMDHGAWPLLTTGLYINMSGDLKFLLEEQTYFKDRLHSFTREIEEEWISEPGNKLKTKTGEIYWGSILEHILLENLTVFFNVGKHNNIRLEDADWNDALDMASEGGESVAFTAFYAGNLLGLIDLLERLKEKENVESVQLLEEISILLDRIFDRVDYNNVEEKRRNLDKYFASCRDTVSGNKISISIDDLVQDLKEKAEWLIGHLREEEWVGDQDGHHGWYNGYYDNQGKRVDGFHDDEIRMTLTGQVFPVMFGIATDEQVKEIIKSADKYLYDKKVGGYRLNTEFRNKALQLGRVQGFAYGHKENGAMFSHMAVMYANALYRRNFVNEGYKVWHSIYEHCLDFSRCRIYPGIPEYINEQGRGMYSYLTGSASWLLLTMITEVFGVNGYYGDLKLEPKLIKEQFDMNGVATIAVNFANKSFEIEYLNTKLLDYGEYKIRDIYLNDRKLSICERDKYILVPLEELNKADLNKNIITVELDII